MKDGTPMPTAALFQLLAAVSPALPVLILQISLSCGLDLLDHTQENVNVKLFFK